MQITYVFFGPTTKNAILLYRSTREASRLVVIIAAQELGDGRNWWMIAAASKIGWAPQVPPGTLLRIPNIDDVLALVG